MKIVRSFFWIFLAQLALGQSPSLPDVEKRLAEEMEKLSAQQAQQIESLRTNYLSALLRLEGSFRAEGDLEGLQQTRMEIQRIDGTNPLRVETPSALPSLQRLQNLMGGQVDELARVHAKGLSDLVGAVTRFAESTSVLLTQQNRIEEALTWREWARALPQRPGIAEALALGATSPDTAITSVAQTQEDLHPLFRQEPPPLVAEGDASFGESPKAYVLGQEPKATEKRVNMSTPSAQGSGLALASALLRLVEEENTLSKSFTGYSSHRQKSHVFVARLQLAPLPGRSIGKSLVVFDLYKKGTGSRREIIRSEMILLPPLTAGQQVVVDSGIYAYESLRARATGGYRYETSTADAFDGFIVSVFAENGSLLLQRSSDRLLDDYARTALPPPPEPEPEVPQP